MKASPAEGQRRLHTNTAYVRLSGSTGLHVEHRRPKAGDAPHEGLLKSKGGGLGVLGFGGLGVLGVFGVWGLGL